MNNDRTRLDSIDLLRGVIMVVMALDHTRDFFGDAGASPTNLATTTAALFFTRWITHFCAPVFFLLAGTGAYFSRRHRTRGGLSMFLLTRGLWLVFLDAVVLRAIIQFNVDYHATILNVLWAIGWSMVALGGLVFLPTWLIGAIGAVMIVGHNALDGISPQTFGSFAPLWIVLHGPGVLYADKTHMLFTAYPLIPWIGVMAVGYAIGPIFSWDAIRRKQTLLAAGLGLTLAFVVLRAINSYGDPLLWKVQSTSVLTVLSFLNTNKYPPSLLFLLMTLGPSLLLLRAMEGKTPRWLEPAVVIGRVPMFYFLLHFLVLHVLAVIVCAVRFGGVHWMFESPTLANFPVTQPPGWPASLPVVYGVWIAVVILVYPACRWYSALKMRRRDPWMSYL